MQALLFLLDALAAFFSLLLLTRFFMQLNRVAFSNQLGSFIMQLTNWAVKPLRRIIPGVMGWDFASLLPAWWLQCLLLLIVVSLRGIAPDGAEMGQLALLVLWRGAVATLRLAIYLFIGALFVQAVLSWVNPFSPLAAPVNQFNRPLLQPIQRFLPPIANIDLSPLVAILLLQVVLMLL
ncbi:YggT family protein [Azospira restricta]|uniref:YggT family protein n=1 Tax=Azospira restricta TaxID=404405 RepID=A0A974Y427_9RHOO|nr:YggT family protein [Azospira restricta]QRJ64230.1 YggT family protein [Azospira restricta]